MFDHIEASHVSQALTFVKKHARGLSAEHGRRIATITDYFRGNREWGIVAKRWEQILIEAGEEGEPALLDAITTLFSIMFAIGFDTGLQHLVDTSVKGLLNDTSLDAKPSVPSKNRLQIRPKADDPR